MNSSYLRDIPLMLTLASLAGLFLWSLWTDITSMKISNRVVLLVMTSFILKCILVPGEIRWGGFATIADPTVRLVAQWSAGCGREIAVSAIFFVFFYTFWAMGKMGGGDVKLMTAASLWFGHDYALAFFLYTALIGGLAALLFICFKKADKLKAFVSGLRWLAPLLRKPKNYFPYAIAITPGALIVLSEQAYNWRLF